MIKAANIYAILLFGTLAAASLSGCSTTKRLGEDDVLYTGVRKMKVESGTEEKLPGKVKSAVQEPLSVKPNNPLFSPYIRTPLPIGLWVWNYFYTEDQKGFKHWIYQRLAKQPVLVSDVQPELRTQIATEVLDNHGYFGSSARYELIPKKNPKKARISYFVEAAAPWYYSSIAYPDICCDVTRAIDSLKYTGKMNIGDRFDIDTLNAERIRITNHLRNNSYYYFRPDYIEYLADTTRERYDVDLRMIMADAIPPAAMQPYRVGEVELEFYNPAGGEMDSLYLNGVKVTYQKPLKIRPRLLQRSLAIHPGDATRVDDINKTLDNLTKLGIFRYVNLTVTPLDSLAGSGADSIDMNITAGFDVPLEAELEVDFSSKSNSFIGPGLIFGIRHKNLLRGGEVLSFRFNGSYEWQTGNRSGQTNSTAINSWEVGFTSSLTFPRLIVPRFIPQARYDNRTTVQLGVNLLNRPKFFTMASFNGALSYDFRTSRRSAHNLTILKMVYSHLLRTTDDFRKVLDNNPAIELSFRNQFIPSASYTYTYDNTFGRNNSDRIVWQTTGITAGNIFTGVSSIFSDGRPHKLFGAPISQFVKGVTEVRHYHQLGGSSTIASRLSVGAGYAYGNSTVLPYSEQFYVGGANSIRAFTVRSVGPGSYRADEDDAFGYFDQTGEFKLEANVEYRFKIIGGLNGAVFLDTGNVWLLREDDSRPGGKLRFGKMWEQLALGTGAGLRFDITYLVIRADLGIGLHAPYNTGKSGFYNIPRFKEGLGFHLAIGYPF